MPKTAYELRISDWSSDVGASELQRSRTMPLHRVRSIATNTGRQLRKPQGFLVPGETALAHAIDVVSGREEARLIYLGVAHGSPPSGRNRLEIGRAHV